jgi:hypothetical protein
VNSEFDFTIKQGDTGPSLVGTLLDGHRAIVALPDGSSVAFRMTPSGLPAGRPVLTHAARIADALNGVVAYDWQSGDTSHVGAYTGDFHVTFPDLTTESFPQAADLRVLVRVAP